MFNYGPIPSFLNKISKNWGVTPDMPKLWAIRFSPSNQYIGGGVNLTLIDEIKKAFDIYPSTEFQSILNATKNLYKNLLSYTPNDTIGIGIGPAAHFILANKLTIPRESLSLNKGFQFFEYNTGGLIPGRVMGVRNTRDNFILTIDFYDSYKEFNEFIIKPWIVACANIGLIDSSELPKLKCNIEAYFFAKSSPESGGHVTPTLRKQIIFKNCIPIDIPEKTYDYSSEYNITNIMTQVKFSFSNIEIRDFSDNISDTINSNILQTPIIKNIETPPIKVDISKK